MQITRLEQELPQGITTQTIESRGHQDEVRRELLQHDVELTTKHILKLRAGGPGRQRQVARSALSCPAARFIARTRARIPGTLVQRHEVDGRVVVKDVLRAVAVM